MNMIMAGNVKATLRAQRLLVDALVAVTEKEHLKDEDLVLLASLAEEGHLMDEDIALIREAGMTEYVREELCQRLGCTVLDVSRMFDIGAPKLAWNDVLMEN